MRILLPLLLVTVSLSGCLGDLLNDITRPDLPVQRTSLVEGDWNHDPRFTVVVAQAEPVEVVITATGPERIVERGFSTADQPIELSLPDGVWDVSYTVAGHEWETFRNVQVDSTPPAIDGLELTGSADGGQYVLGASAVAEPDADIVVLIDGVAVAQQLPATLAIGEGLTSILVVATDPAGNERSYIVQVRSGDAEFLPDGRWDFGIVARYTNAARVWDLQDLDAYLTPEQSANAVSGAWLADGHGVTPNAQAVQQVVAEVVTPGAGDQGPGVQGHVSGPAEGGSAIEDARQYSPHVLIEEFCRGARSGGAIPMIRIPNTSRDYVLHALDAGASIVVAPMVETAETSREMVSRTWSA